MDIDRVSGGQREMCIRGSRGGDEEGVLFSELSELPLRP